MQYILTLILIFGYIQNIQTQPTFICCVKYTHKIDVELPDSANYELALPSTYTLLWKSSNYRFRHHLFLISRFRFRRMFNNLFKNKKRTYDKYKINTFISAIDSSSKNSYADGEGLFCRPTDEVLYEVFLNRENYTILVRKGLVAWTYFILKFHF